MVALAKKGKLKPMPVETRPAQRSERARSRICKAGRVVGRVVLDFEADRGVKRKPADTTAQHVALAGRRGAGESTRRGVRLAGAAVLRVQRSGRGGRRRRLPAHLPRRRARLQACCSTSFPRARSSSSAPTTRRDSVSVAVLRRCFGVQLRGRWRCGASRFAPTTPRSCSSPRRAPAVRHAPRQRQRASRARPSAACTRCAACSSFRRSSDGTVMRWFVPPTRARTRPASASRSARCWSSRSSPRPKKSTPRFRASSSAALAALRRIPDREPDRLAGAARRGAQAAAQPADAEARRDAGRARLPHRGASSTRRSPSRRATARSRSARSSPTWAWSTPRW